MATFTGLCIFYFFFASIACLIKYLSAKKCNRASGVIIEVSAPVKDSKKVYTYTCDVKIENEVYKYKVVKDSAEERENLLFTTIECLTNEKKHTVISTDDFDKLKKGLYMNPILCVASIAATVLLIFIASTI